MDCSSTACSVAISRDGVRLAGEHKAMARGHAAALPPMISSVLAAAGQTPPDLDAIAVSTGPGSFTGLRVGMAAAKGLALSLDRPLVGLSCFDAVARKVTSGDAGWDFDILLLALASKREDIFVRGLNRGGVEIIPGQVLTPTAIRERFGSMLNDAGLLLLAGEAANSLAEVFPRARSNRRARVEIGPVGPPDAADIAILAHEFFARDPARPRFYETGLAPIYMRPPATATPRP